MTDTQTDKTDGQDLDGGFQSEQQPSVAITPITLLHLYYPNYPNYTITLSHYYTNYTIKLNVHFYTIKCIKNQTNKIM